MSPGSARRRVAVVAALVGSLSVSAACGVPLDSQPRTLHRSAVAQPKSEPRSGSTSTYLYFLANGKIVAAARAVADLQPATVLTALIADLTAEETASQLVSQIPRGTSLRSATVNGSVLTVDLSTGFDDLVGTARGQAAGQIVLTATELPNIEEVSFLVDGKPSKVYSSVNGDTNRVRACDFLPLLASNDDMRVDQLWPAAVRHVNGLRLSLMSRCPDSPTNRTTSAR